jgi:hypothetical protein
VLCNSAGSPDYVTYILLDRVLSLVPLLLVLRKRTAAARVERALEGAAADDVFEPSCVGECATPRERERGTEKMCRILDVIAPEEPSLDELLSSTLERTSVFDISVESPPPSLPST